MGYADCLGAKLKAKFFSTLKSFLFLDLDVLACIFLSVPSIDDEK